MANIPLKERGLVSGRGGYGYDFSPWDRKIVKGREKLKKALDGTDSLSYNELQKLVADTIFNG